MRASILKRRFPASRARVAVLAGGVLVLLGTTAAYSMMPAPPPGPNPGAHPPPPQSPPPPVVTPLVPPIAVTPPKPPAPPPVMPGPTSPSGPAGVNARRITEIVPPPSYAASAAQAANRPMPPNQGVFGGMDPWASANPCVNVFVRSTKVDGREVVSADLHGDGLIKAAVPPHLGGELLARAGPVTGAGGARAACVPPTLAQTLFNPVVNVAAVDPAVRMTRVGDRWVLAGSRAPEAVAKVQAPVQLAAATTTRGGSKKPTKKSPSARAKPATSPPTQVAMAYFP